MTIKVARKKSGFPTMPSISLNCLVSVKNWAFKCLESEQRKIERYVYISYDVLCRMPLLRKLPNSANKSEVWKSSICSCL